MAIYKCNHCQLVGSGIPASRLCPNCKEELYVKIRSTGENQLDGDFISIDDAISEILCIAKTFNHTKCKLYVSDDISKFLKTFMPLDKYNFIVDSRLRDFEMNVR